MTLDQVGPTRQARLEKLSAALAKALGVDAVVVVGLRLIGAVDADGATESVVGPVIVPREITSESVRDILVSLVAAYDSATEGPKPPQVSK